MVRACFLCCQLRSLAARTVGVLVCGVIFSHRWGRSYFVGALVLAGAVYWVWKGRSHFIGVLAEAGRLGGARGANKVRGVC